MKLNCKPGDLAIHVKSDRHENLGCIVEVVSYFGFTDASHCWVTKGGSGVLSRDEHLRPLDDSDGDDETLAWSGKPEQVTS